MIRRILLVLVNLIALVVIGGCVTPDGQTTVTAGSGKSPTVAGKGEAILLVNGEKIYAADLISSTMLRQALRQYIYFHNLRKIAAAEGVTADPVAVDEHVELLKQRLVERGDTWEKYLSELSMTEDEYRSNIVDSLLQDGIVEKRVGVTPEKMRKIWDEQRDNVISEYMISLHLPDSEKDGITYEDCEDLLRAKVLRVEGVPVMGNLQAELALDATLEILCMSDPEMAARHEFLILDSDKKQTEDRLPEGGKYTMPGEKPDDGEAGDAKATGGVDSAIGSK